MSRHVCLGLAWAACLVASMALVSPTAAVAAPIVRADAAPTPKDGPILRPDDPAQRPKPILPGPDIAAPPKAPPAPPTNRQARTDQSLDDLFKQLHDAGSEAEARPIDAMIQSRLMSSGSDTVDLLMERALLAVQGEDMPLAFDLLDSIIALKPDYAEGWNKRATLYFLAHDYGKAISDVEMVLRLQPRHYHALIGLAGMLNELGDKTYALAALRQVLVLYPANTEVAKDAAELQTAIEGHAL